MEENTQYSSDSSDHGQNTPDSIDVAEIEQGLDSIELAKANRILETMGKHLAGSEQSSSSSSPRSSVIKHTTSINIMADSLPEDEDPRHKMDFFLSWENIIIHEDNCFLYTDNGNGAAAFKSRMNGQSPEDFARVALSRDVEAFSHVKATGDGEDFLVSLMLRFWQQRSKIWRLQFRSKEAAREDFKQREQHLRLLPDLFKRRVNRNAKGQLSLGVCNVALGEEDHLVTASVIPMLEDDCVAYETQRITYCHKGCLNTGKVDLDALQDKLKEQHDMDLKLLVAAKGIEDPKFK